MSSETGPNVNLRIDKSGPRVSVTNVTAGSQYVTTAVPVAACSTNDSLSGVVSQERSHHSSDAVKRVRLSQSAAALQGGVETEGPHARFRRSQKGTGA